MNPRYISAWSILHPVPVVVLFLILSLAGLTAFVGLNIDEQPNIDIPIVSVTVTQLGAAPSELETQVTRKIEDAVAGIGSIKHITSTVNEGATNTIIEFELDSDVDRAVNDVRNEVSKIRTQLPAGIDEPIIQRLNWVGVAFVSYTVSSQKRSVDELSWIIDNQISRQLMSVKGVGQVQRAGGVDREIRVNLDPFRLEAVGATADMVSQQIRATNINLPGGRGEVGSQEESIRTLGSAETPENLAAARIMLPNKTWVRLDTIGSIKDASSEPRQMAMLNGQPVVAFSIVRSVGSNMTAVEEGVDHKLKEVQADLPSDIKIKKIRTQTAFVHDSYHATIDSLVIGALLAVFVVWLFLRDMRAAIITSLAMPLSLIPTFYVMQVAGFTMNNMTLLALALVIGILVDDAIVEIENIVRHMAMGKSPFQAALEAADEIGLAVVATTATIMVVFIPVAFMGGIPGKFLKQFGLTVTAAVFFSLVVARMLTPLMAAYFLKTEKHVEAQGGMLGIYDKLVNWSIRHRLTTVITGVVFFIASIVLFRMMPTSVIGNIDRGESIVSVELPPGSRIGQTRDILLDLSAKIQKRPEVALVFAQIGTPSSGRFGRSQAGDVNKGTLYVSLKPRGERKLSQQQFEESIRPMLLTAPGARISFMRHGGITGKLKVVLIGENSAELAATAEKLTDGMRSIPGVFDVVSSASISRPEIQIYPDFARASEQGVSVASIARTALIATLGDAEANLPKFNLDERQINIRVQIDPKFRLDPNQIGNLRVVRHDGGLVPLSAVAEVKYGSGPAQIDRYDRARQVAIEASLAQDVPLGKALSEVFKLSAYKNKPHSVKDIPSGDVEIQKDIFSGFQWALVTGVILIYAVLVLLFGGFAHPLTIMMSLPLSLGGALIALIVSGQPLGFYALIGIVMLMGLVTKNAILLVEYGLMAKKAGLEGREAILQAGRTRMRPIVMTTVAMIAGMAPIALGIGAGSEARAPMALAVVGGLVTSTLLTLIVVPVVFTYIEDFQKWLVSKVDFARARHDLPETASDKANVGR